MTLEDSVRHPYGAPYPSTGSQANADALLSMFGQGVILEDTTTIKGIFRKAPRFDGLEISGPNQNRNDYRLYVPEVRNGSLDKEQGIYIPGTARVWRVLNVMQNGDGWNIYTITYDNEGQASDYPDVMPSGGIPVIKVFFMEGTDYPLMLPGGAPDINNIAGIAAGDPNPVVWTRLFRFEADDLSAFRMSGSLLFTPDVASALYHTGASFEAVAGEIPGIADDWHFRTNGIGYNTGVAPSSYPINDFYEAARPNPAKPELTTYRNTNLVYSDFDAPDGYFYQGGGGTALYAARFAVERNVAANVHEVSVGLRVITSDNRIVTPLTMHLTGLWEFEQITLTNGLVALP